MKRRCRTQILVEGAPELAETLSLEAEKTHEVRDVDNPSGGLVMMRMRDTARRDAYFLGEVLVTEAKVRIGEILGIGLIRGDRPDLARQLAVIDAAFNVESSLIESWLSRLEAEKSRLTGIRSQEAAEILKTRVEFSTMESF